MEVMHLGDTFHSSLNCMAIKKTTPVIHRYIDGSIMFPNQLGIIDGC